MDCCEIVRPGPSVTVSVNSVPIFQKGICHLSRECTVRHDHATYQRRTPNHNWQTVQRVSEIHEIHDVDKGSTYDNVIGHNGRGRELVRHASTDPGVGAPAIDQQGVCMYIRKVTPTVAITTLTISRGSANTDLHRALSVLFRSRWKA